jgi:hypothetical protein
MAIDEDKVVNLAGEIQRYLATHPDAADSVDGIRQWWLARMRLEETAMQVQQALDLLVVQGAVVERRMPDGSVLYESARRSAGRPG